MTSPSTGEGAVFNGPSWDLPQDSSAASSEPARGIDSFSGRASNYVEKWHTERMARKVAREKVQRESTTPQTSPPVARDDNELKRLAIECLEAMKPDHRKRIRVLVREAQITLAGEVESEHAHRTALLLVGKMGGSPTIIDHLVVMTELSEHSVKSEIQEALTRRSIADALHISVMARGSEITLLGTVRGRTERDLAVDAAWCTPGVRRVFDKLKIANS